MNIRQTATRALLGVALLSAPALGLAQEVRDVWRARLPQTERHPCLLFTPEQLPALRERLKRPPYAWWWTNAQGSGDMVSQAFVWSITGDREKAEAVRRQLLRCYPTGYHCCCGVADALQGVAEAYDLIADYDGLTPTDHRVIRAKIANACERLYLSALETGNGQHPGNQRTRGICALGTAAIVLSGYDRSAHTPLEWLQRALDGIHQEANLLFWREDGMFIEGPTYSAFTLSVMVPFARYFERASGQWLFDDPRLRNALLYLVSITQPDGECAALGTTNMLNLASSLKLCIGAGRPEDQALFRWMVAEWGSLEDGGAREIGLFDDRVQPSAAFPTTRFFRTSQEASVRSDWSRNAVALWFKGKDPWLARGYDVYSHGDVGSFVIHAYGELLAVDAGYDHWVSRDLYPPELHNTLLVDGKGPGSETPGLMERTLDTGFLRAGDIVASYAGVEHRRTCCLVDDRYVLLADDARAPAAHEYAWQVHTPVSRPGGRVRIEGNRASWTGYDPRTDTPGQVTMEAAWAPPVELATMEKSRWQPWSPDPKTGSYDNWAIVAKQRAPNARYLAVLYPHPTSVQPPTIESPAVAGGRCLVISDAGARDTALVAEGASVSSGRVTSTARTCLVRERGGALEWAYLAGPGRVEVAGKLVASMEGDGALALRPGPPGAAWRLSVAGPADLRVKVGGVPPGSKAYLLPTAGDWRELPATQDADGLTVTLPEQTEAGVVLLKPPTLKSLPVRDDLPPRVLSATMDGKACQEEWVDLGRVAASPKQLRVEFRDELSPVDLTSARVTVDGLPNHSLPRVEMNEDWHRTAVAADLDPVNAATDHEVVVSLADGAPVPNRGQFTLRFTMRPLLSNGGFEAGGSQPTSWSLGSWSGDEQTHFEMRTVTDRPHSGKRCLLIRGVAGSLNLCASQGVALEVGRTYVLTGYYRGDVPAGASLCSSDGKGQYIWSPPFGPAAEWTPFRWEFTVENPAPTLLVALRLGKVGSAFFDDVELKVKG